FRTRADAERFLRAPYEPPVPDLAAWRRARDRLGDEGLVLVGLENPLCLPAAWFSPEEFCLAWAEAPDLVEALVRAAAERLAPYVDALCRAGVEGFRIVGGEYASVQLGPAAFRRLAIPYDRALVELMHRHGALAYYHNHGKVKGILPDLASIGMDALDPLEAPPWGDVADLGAARKAVDGRVCLVGNLDDMEVLERGNPEEAVRLGRERLRAAGRTGFILGGTASGTYGESAARAFMALARMAAEEASG
ncbi:MAG: uroporphyrinogen decarboxylase family protein, partial [bacterium]